MKPFRKVERFDEFKTTEDGQQIVHFIQVSECGHQQAVPESMVHDAGLVQRRCEQCPDQ